MRLKPPKRERRPRVAAPAVVHDLTDAPRSARREPAPTASPDPSDVSFFSLGPDEFALIPVAGDPAPTLSTLSDAETRVLAELATGRTNREIATSRGTSLRTITNQVSAVFRKLGVRSRSELVLLLAGRKAREVGDGARPGDAVERDDGSNTPGARHRNT